MEKHVCEYDLTFLLQEVKISRNGTCSICALDSI